MFRQFIRFFYSRILLPACGIFTLLVFFVSLISSFSNETGTPCILISQALLLLLYSIVLSFLNLIFSARSLSLVAKLSIHFIASLAAMLLILLLLSGFYGNFGMPHLLFIVALYAVLYVLIAGGYLAIRRLKSKK